MTVPTLGTTLDGKALTIGVDRLVVSRMLLQANSGGGKSWALRRILEQTHGKVQHLVLDVEGEFHTLRERFDYVLAARTGGDTLADVRTAQLLARRLLELGVSAIVDIYELPAHERIRFVRLFLEALVDAPKTLWHPALIVIDEAHVFCPESTHAESSGAVIDLMTRGRKRGFGGILATQRLSKLHKDAAAEANCKLIGRASLDVDMKRAGAELGFTTRDDLARLRTLAAGQFFAFGPGLSDQVVEVVVGDVVTTHPKAGRGAAPIPPPRERVQKILGQLADLPKEAEAEARSIEDLRRENRELKRQVAAKPEPAAPTVEIREVEVVKPETVAQLVKIADSAKAAGLSLVETGNAWIAKADEVVAAAKRTADSRGSYSRPIQPAARPRGQAYIDEASFLRRDGPAKSPAPGHASDVQPVQQRILDAIAEIETLGGSDRPDRALVALLAGYTNTTSKGFANAIGALSSAGHVTYPDDGRVSLTESGAALARAPDRPRTSAEIQDRICSLLGGASERILRPLIDAYPKAVARDEVARAAGYTNVTSKGFANAVGRLSSLGFIRYPSRGEVAAQPVLFLEGQR